MDFGRVFDVVDELGNFVNREPRLLEFVSAVSAVRDQAEALALGSKHVPVLSRWD